MIAILIVALVAALLLLAGLSFDVYTRLKLLDGRQKLADESIDFLLKNGLETVRVAKEGMMDLHNRVSFIESKEKLPSGAWSSWRQPGL